MRNLLRGAFALTMALLAHSAGAQDWHYLAQPGDNLWNLAGRYLDRGVARTEALRAHNGIGQPRRLRPGEIVRIPLAWLVRQPSQALVIEVRGTAERVAGAGAGPLAPGDALRSGDTVRTGADSSVTIELADRSLLLLQAGTDVAFDDLSEYRDTGMTDSAMSLGRGRVESRVRPATGPGSGYRVTTPAAVAAVRGTELRVGFEAGAMRTEVTEGTVAVAGTGAERAVGAGFGLLARGGAPVGEPRALLQAPDTAALPARFDRLVLAIEWPPVPGARGYRAQLYPAGNATRLLQDSLVTAPRVEWDAPPDGRYRVRLRAVDADGLEGVDADREIGVDARPVPPAQLKPEDAAAMHGEPPELWWSRPEGADSYRVQIASDAMFAETLHAVEALRAERYRPAIDLEPGVYHWRVAQRDGAGDVGPFGDARTFRMQAVPEPPGAGGSVIDAQSVRISWPAAANAVRYELQVARDDQFTDLVVEETLDAREFVMESPGAGEYHFRARGVSEEGVVGPFGTASQFTVDAKPWSPWWLLLLPLLILL